MRITKWVDMGAEVDVDIDARDISAALSEAFSVVVEPKFEEVATARDVIRAIAMVGTFLTALTDEHIAALNEAQRTTVFRFLTKETKRWGKPIAVPASEPVACADSDRSAGEAAGDQ